MFERVDLRKLSTSASPPRILSVAVAWVNVGVSLVPVVADVVEVGGGRDVLAVVGQAVADDLDERQALKDGAFLRDRLDDAGEERCRC